MKGGVSSSERQNFQLSKTEYKSNISSLSLTVDLSEAFDAANLTANLANDRLYAYSSVGRQALE